MVLFKARGLHALGAMEVGMGVGWRNWYHVTANPYGQWLRGDPRGWRERHHRLHVEGDYKHRPEATAYNRAIFEQSKRLMKFPPVSFSIEQRREVGVHALRSLEIQKIAVLAVGVGARHLHALVRCPANDPKRVVGKIKNHVWMQMINEGEKLKPRAEVPPLWAVGSHAEPIEDKAHQNEAFWYILEHRDEGAWVWCYRDVRDGSCACEHRRRE